MNVAGADRNRQLVTVGIGAVLTLVMTGVLIFGFRLATQMRASVTGLQTASMLQTYPDAITQQLNSLRDRLEARATANHNGAVALGKGSVLDGLDCGALCLGDVACGR